MQAHLPTTETSTRTSGLGRWTTVAGLSLALALTAGIGLMRITGDDAAHDTIQTAASVGQHTESDRSAAPAGEQRHVVYIAETREQAAHALRFSAEINVLRAELGQPLVAVGALVAGPDSTLALDGLPGAPGTRFFDLRMP